MRKRGPVDRARSILSAEMLADATATKRASTLSTSPSMGLAQTGECLKMIEEARRRGVDVTTEAYPYTAAMTDLGSAIFDEAAGRQGGITFHDLQWAATGGAAHCGELCALSQQGRVCGHSFHTGRGGAAAMANPLVMIGAMAFG